MGPFGSAAGTVKLSDTNRLFLSSPPLPRRHRVRIATDVALRALPFAGFSVLAALLSCLPSDAAQPALLRYLLLSNCRLRSFRGVSYEHAPIRFGRIVSALLDEVFRDQTDIVHSVAGGAKRGEIGFAVVAVEDRDGVAVSHGDDAAFDNPRLGCRRSVS